MQTQNGQTIFDTIMQGYGSLESAITLLIDNELTFDSLIESGQELDITSDSNSNAEVVEFYVRTQNPNNAQNEATPSNLGRLSSTSTIEVVNSDAAKDGQGVFDICVQEWGTLEEIIRLINDNDLSVDSILTSSQALIIDNENRGVNDVKNFYLFNRLTANNNCISVKDEENSLTTTFDSTTVTWDSTILTF